MAVVYSKKKGSLDPVTGGYEAIDKGKGLTDPKQVTGLKGDGTVDKLKGTVNEYQPATGAEVQNPATATTTTTGTGTGAAGTDAAAALSDTAYTGLQGISPATAEKIGQLQQGYQESPEVQAAMNALQAVMDQKPKGYESKYSATLDGILQQILNPQEFKYSFNGDALFQSLADQYTQRGRQASLDAMGQAAAMTGGYGNSYGQMMGQQQYQQYLQGLYDRGIDLYDRAYQKYRDDQGNLYNRLGAVQGMDESDYARYRDTVGDWMNERDYFTGRADTLADRDYGRYADELNYWTGLGQAENADMWTGKNFEETVRMNDESIRQWQEQFDYNKMSDDRKYAFDIVTKILANGQMPSKAQLAAAGISEKDAKKMMADTGSSGGSGGGGGGGGGDTVYVGPDGKLYKFDKDGKITEVNPDDLPRNTKVIESDSGKKKVQSAMDDEEKIKKSKKIGEILTGLKTGITSAINSASGK